MKTLRSENRVIAHLFIILVLIGLLSAVVFYCEINNFIRKEETGNVAEEVEDRTTTDLLLEYKDNAVADQLSRKVRVLCWVMTEPRSHYRKARHVKATWGKRCNVFLMMSTTETKSLPTIALSVPEGPEYSWGKTKAAFQYVYDHHRDQADWFMKVDDDTYVIVENLRYMLADHNSRFPIYFGCRFKHKTQSYMSGGAGYVLSRGALDTLIDKGLSGPTHCRVYDHGAEDFEMGKCLSKLGVAAGDSRDTLRRGRFFPFGVGDHLLPNWDLNFWYWSYVYYPAQDGLNCCSEYAISFHYIAPNNMYVLDYLIYQLRPYGIEYKTGKLPRMLTESGNATVYNAVIDDVRAEK